MVIARSTPAAAVASFTSVVTFTGIAVPAGALLAVGGGQRRGSTGSTITTTDSGSHTWTRRAYVGNGGHNDFAVVDDWYNGTGSPVTIDVTVDTDATLAIGLQLLAGVADPSVSPPQVVTGTQTAANELTITPQTAGSQILLSWADELAALPTTFEPGSGADTSPASQAALAGGPVAGGWMFRTATETTTGSPVTVGASDAGASRNSLIAVEYQPAAGGGAQLPVAGTVAAVSDASLVATGRYPVSGTAGASSDVSLTASALYPVSAQPAVAVSAVALDATAQRPVSGAVVAVSDASLDVVLVSGGGFAVSGTVAAVSAAVCAVSLRAAVAGTAPAVSAVRLDAPALHPVAGSAAVVSASRLDATAAYHVAGAVQAATGAALTAAGLLATAPLPVEAVSAATLTAGLFGFIPDLWPDDLGTYREATDVGTHSGPDNLGTYREAA